MFEKVLFLLGTLRSHFNPDQRVLCRISFQFIFFEIRDSPSELDIDGLVKDIPEDLQPISELQPLSPEYNPRSQSYSLRIENQSPCSPVSYVSDGHQYSPVSPSYPEDNTGTGHNYSPQSPKYNPEGKFDRDFENLILGARFYFFEEVLQSSKRKLLQRQKQLTEFTVGVNKCFQNVFSPLYIWWHAMNY